MESLLGRFLGSEAAADACREGHAAREHGELLARIAYGQALERQEQGPVPALPAFRNDVREWVREELRSLLPELKKPLDAACKSIAKKQVDTAVAKALEDQLPPAISLALDEFRDRLQP
jgi:hypothetical protein